jgi:hypothetical protein
MSRELAKRLPLAEQIRKGLEEAILIRARRARACISAATIPSLAGASGS